MLQDKIDAIKAQIAGLTADSAEALEALRIRYMSKKGEIAALFNDFKLVPPEQKREMGQRLNEVKTLVTDRLAQLREQFAATERERNRVDITRPAMPEMRILRPCSSSGLVTGPSRV